MYHDRPTTRALSRILRVGALAAAALFPCVGSAEGGYSTDKPLELRKVMQELGRHMQTVTDAISREDWDVIVKAAPQIAEHPAPPALEKARILAFVGTDAGKFKANDDNTHKAAEALMGAAQRKDGAAVIGEFARLQSACMSCHQQFRQPIVKHFYGAN